MQNLKKWAIETDLEYRNTLVNPSYFIIIDYEKSMAIDKIYCLEVLLTSNKNISEVLI